MNNKSIRYDQFLFVFFGAKHLTNVEIFPESDTVFSKIDTFIMQSRQANQTSNTYIISAYNNVPILNTFRSFI